MNIIQNVVAIIQRGPVFNVVFFLILFKKVFIYVFKLIYASKHLKYDEPQIVSTIIHTNRSSTNRRINNDSFETDVSLPLSNSSERKTMTHILQGK